MFLSSPHSLFLSTSSSNGGICSSYLPFHPPPPLSPPSFRLSEYLCSSGVYFGSCPEQPVLPAWPSPWLPRYLPTSAITNVGAWQTGGWCQRDFNFTVGTDLCRDEGARRAEMTDRISPCD